MNKQRIKGVETLKAELLAFMDEIIYSLSCELERVGRSVELSELKYKPFIEEVTPYVDTIRLDGDMKIIIDTSFADVDEKFLWECISDKEIDPFGLLDLLAFLKAVPGKNGAMPSILMPVTGEQIRHEEADRDAWVCICGNTPDHGGFYACDSDGDHIEPANDWEYLYRCNGCGRVIDDRDHKVIGINLNPNDEEAW